ncbi:hypothetical protein GOV13_05310 [Candidatus Pacearchaeota archaeon]|nr:hypothetical protein [Candidatus Pacearchaeota archaeon]
MERGDKSGQFYLVGAIILIAFIIGFATISNYSKKMGGTKIIELGEELKVEGARVLDYNIINDEDKIEDFTITFSEYAGEDVEIYYIFGKESGLELYNGTGFMSPLGSVDGKIQATIEGVGYDFDLKSGENFYFVILQEIEGEYYIVTN